MIDIKNILNDRKKTWGILLFLILCALAFVLLFKYDFGSFRKIQFTIAENKHNKATLDSLGEYKKYLKKFNACLVPDNGIDWLMGTLTVVSKNNGVTLSAVKPIKTEYCSGYEVVKASIEGTSSYKELLRFIKAIEDGKEYMLIESISIRSIEIAPDEFAKNSPAVLTRNVSRGRLVGFNAIIAYVALKI